jgi:Ca2+-binding RTX toxin-like protein
VNGGAGTDTALLGAGNDRFQWNPGEGSDVIDGGRGHDTHEFNGSAGNERMALAVDGDKVLLTRDLGNIVMTQDNFERVEIAARGGSDSLTIGDMGGSDVREVAIDLAAVAGDATGDGVLDSVAIDGGSRGEFISVTAQGDTVNVKGLAASTRIDNLDAGDRIDVRGGAGNDVIQALLAPAGVAVLNLDGGAGNDVLVGSRGADTLDGGTGRDVLIGGAGDDTFLGDDDVTVLDFRAGAGSEDRLDLRGRGVDDFGDVLALARDVGGGMVIDFGDDEITLLGVSTSQLAADDFLI